MEEFETCKNCETKLKGDFCHNCGQKHVVDKTIKYIMGQLLSALYFVDSKFIRSIKYFLFFPGKLSRAFIEGKRVDYISPISLFFILNICYFLFNSASDLNLSLTDQISLQEYSPWAKELVKERLTQNDLTFQEYSIAYNTESSSLSKTLIILNIPVLTLFVVLLNIRRNYYFLDHFIYATHLMTFILFCFTFLFPIIWYLISAIGNTIMVNFDDLYGAYFSIPISIIYIIYVFISFRKAFAANIVHGAIASIVLAIGFLAMNLSYRFVLFVATYYTLG
ncbi:MAG: DUF3667 domain-containing protein [Reichenbachiella sp.]